MIHAQFETTALDWSAFRRYAVASVRGFTGKASLGFSWRSIVVGMPVGILIVVATQLFPFRIHVPTAAVFVGTFMLFLTFFSWRLARALTPTAGGALIGHRHILLDEQGVTEESTSHRHQSAWLGIVSVGETRDHVFLMVDRLAGYIVPKRAFLDSSELEAFLAFARIRVGQQEGSTRPSRPLQPVSDP